MGSPTTNQLKEGTLKFCGVKPVRMTLLEPVRTSTDVSRERWLNQVTKLGKTLR